MSPVFIWAYLKWRHIDMIIFELTQLFDQLML